MKNSTKKNNLQKYAAVAGAFLASGAVNGQIMYTDVNPDVVISVANGNSPYLIDMDGDTNDDLGIVVDSFSGSFTTYISGYGTYNIGYSGSYAAVAGQPSLGAAMDSSSNAAVLSSGSTINSTNSFTSSGLMGIVGSSFFTAIPISSSWSDGPWLGQNDKFMGVAFDIGGNTHYGWVRLSVAADASSVTIHDYAYNAAPGGSIQAGQVAGLEGVLTADKVNFKTLLNYTEVNVTPDLVGSTIVMVDMMGNEISSKEITEVNTTIEYGDITSGIYMITVNTESDSVSKKVYVK